MSGLLDAAFASLAKSGEAEDKGEFADAEKELVVAMDGFKRVLKEGKLDERTRGLLEGKLVEMSSRLVELRRKREEAARLAEREAMERLERLQGPKPNPEEVAKRLEAYLKGDKKELTLEELEERLARLKADGVGGGGALTNKPAEVVADVKMPIDPELASAMAQLPPEFVYEVMKNAHPIVVGSATTTTSGPTQQEQAKKKPTSSITANVTDPELAAALAQLPPGYLDEDDDLLTEEQRELLNGIEDPFARAEVQRLLKSDEPY